MAQTSRYTILLQIGINLIPDPVVITLAFPSPTVVLGTLSISPTPVVIPIVFPDATVVLTYTITPTPVILSILFPDATLVFYGFKKWTRRNRYGGRLHMQD